MEKKEPTMPMLPPRKQANKQNQTIIDHSKNQFVFYAPVDVKENLFKHGRIVEQDTFGGIIVITMGTRMNNSVHIEI
jgi:hypothetical protein